MKQQIIDKILSIEGGYVNDPADSGGETNYGITVATARAYGYTGAMKDLPRPVAVAIYDKLYWQAVRADDLPEPVAAKVVDIAVNMGVTRAGQILQRALNVLTPGGLVVDGRIGPATLRTLKAVRDIQILVKALNCLQGAYYIDLAERREKDKRFIYGWLKNRIS